MLVTMLGLLRVNGRTYSRLRSLRGDFPKEGPIRSLAFTVVVFKLTNISMSRHDGERREKREETYNKPKVLSRARERKMTNRPDARKQERQQRHGALLERFIDYIDRTQTHRQRNNVVLQLPIE